MKELIIKIKAEVDDDGLNEVLEQYKTVSGKIDLISAFNNIIQQGINEVDVSFNGNLKKMIHDYEVDVITMYDNNKFVALAT